MKNHRTLTAIVGFGAIALLVGATWSPDSDAGPPGGRSQPSIARCALLDDADAIDACFNIPTQPDRRYGGSALRLRQGGAFRSSAAGVRGSRTCPCPTRSLATCATW